jgi:flavin reductase (DIM6/NTAB) family NADH-FMN oxidoreductase RutF
MQLLTSALSHRELYNIILSSVAPRPIAWVSTLSESGQPNLAPFSFFNCVCVDPPLLAFAPGLRSPDLRSPRLRSLGLPSQGLRPPQPSAEAATGVPKDTLRNIRETREFVVSIVTYELLERMNITSGEYDPSVNEFELAKLTPQPSQIVRPARVGESPVSFECRLHQILDFSSKPTGSSLVIGEVVAIYLDDAHLKDGSIDRDSLDLIGRMGGLQYTRTTQRVELARPKVE